MKHFVYLLIIAGAFVTTACSTTGTNDTSAQDSATEATPAAPAETTEPQTSTGATTEEAAPAPDPAPAPAAESQTPVTTDPSSYDLDISYICTHDGNVRTIRIVYHDEGPVVCEVIYEKATGTKTLWTANNDESYCTGRAAGFIVKQEHWGWSCDKQ